MPNALEFNPLLLDLWQILFVNQSPNSKPLKQIWRTKCSHSSTIDTAKPYFVVVSSNTIQQHNFSLYQLFWHAIHQVKAILYFQNLCWKCQDLGTSWPKHVTRSIPSHFVHIDVSTIDAQNQNSIQFMHQHKATIDALLSVALELLPYLEV